MLSLLGKDSIKEKLKGPPIQKDLASRWNNVLINGMTEDEKMELLEKYPTPENCNNAAPKINKLVAGASSDKRYHMVLRRDEKIAARQNQICASITAIGSVLSELLENEGDKKYIQALSDAGRLLLDVINKENKSRKELISINLNSKLKETLDSAKTDEWLFGKDLEEIINSSKSLEQSSKILLKQPTDKTSQQLNFRSLPRSIQGNRQSRQQKTRIPMQSRYKQYKDTSNRCPLQNRYPPQNRYQEYRKGTQMKNLRRN